MPFYNHSGNRYQGPQGSQWTLSAEAAMMARVSEQPWFLLKIIRTFFVKVFLDHIHFKEAS